MSDPVTPAAGETLTFGADPIVSVGVIQSITENNSVEIAEAKDENGKTIAQKAFSKNKEFSIEALFQTGTTPPGAGETVAIGGVAYLVTASNVTKSNSEFTKISITASRKDSASLIVYS